MAAVCEAGAAEGHGPSISTAKTTRRRSRGARPSSPETSRQKRSVCKRVGRDARMAGGIRRAERHEIRGQHSQCALYNRRSVPKSGGGEFANKTKPAEAELLHNPSSTVKPYFPHVTLDAGAIRLPMAENQRGISSHRAQY